MFKIIVLHHLPDMNDLPAAERWFHRYHIPEVLRQSPVSYRCFWAVPPPPGAESYGYYNYKVHENISPTEEVLGWGFTSITPRVVPLEVIMAVVPTRPTEDFMGGDLTPDEKTILRWIIAFKYPDDVPVEDGESWYLNVHTKEVMQQPGLIRFFSYRTLPYPVSLAAVRKKQGILPPKPELSNATYRVSEQWYENSNGWVKSIIDSPPKYTKPPWARYDKYPFLEPFVDFASTFILERPNEDYTRDVRPFYI